MVDEVTGTETPKPLVAEETPESKLAKVTDELEQTKKRLSESDRRVTKTSEDLKRVQDLRDELDELKENQKLYLAFLAQREQTTEADMSETIKADKTNLLKLIEDKEKGFAEKRKQSEAKRRQEEYAVQADQIWTQAEASKTLSRQEKIDVYKALKEGDLALAKLVIGSPETKPEKAKEDVEEAARKILEERGQLTTDLGGAGGSGTGRVYTIAEVEKMSPEDYKKNFPTYSDFLKAAGEGRVK